MTPERMAALVARWVRWYTRDLPGAVAQRRIEELDADVHDHIAHERARAAGERRIAVGIAARMLRGVAADASWRRSQAVARAPRPASRSVLRVALVTAFVLLLPLIGMQVSDEVQWSPADFVFAAVLLAGTGLLLELAARRPRTAGPRVAAAAVGVAAMALGEADDAPGLVLFGLLLLAGTVGLTLRASGRSA
ncbi:MAG TPA: hypothetical protein VD931_05055 [Baekduia sp.]|nr:hypothetical protein [Baekduia sp.]